MTITADELVTDLAHALTAARTICKQRYLNSGQSYTYTLLVTLVTMAERNGERQGIDIDTLLRVNSLSASTVKGHLRELGRQHLIVRDDTRVFVL